MEFSNRDRFEYSDMDLLSQTKNKANILSGTSIPMFCDLFWEATGGNKDLVQSLCETMSVVYQNGLHREAMAILCILFELLEMVMPEDIRLLAENEQALDKFLIEMMLDFDDTFGELLADK